MMSITSILRGNEWPELRAFLKESSPSISDFVYKGAPSVKSDEYACDLEAIDLPLKEATLVGELAEYLFAFSLCRYLDQHKEEAFSSIFGPYDTRGSYLLRTEYLHTTLKEHKEKVFEYAHGQNMPFQTLVDASQFLYAIENVGLFGGSEKLEESAKARVPDSTQNVLFKMVSLFESVFIECNLVTPQSVVFFHPWFGRWGSFLGGAIADLFIDGYIYEIKSGKQLKNKWTDIGQVYTYYLLNRLCEDDQGLQREKNSTGYDLCNYKVEGIALYYSRSGIVKHCPVKDFNTARNRNDESHLRKIISTRVNSQRKQRYEKNLSIYASEILRRRYSEIRAGKRELIQYDNAKKCPYRVGEKVFLWNEGWGTIELITKKRDELVAIVSMDCGKKWCVPVNRVEMLSKNDPELTKLVHLPDYLPE